MCFTSDECGSHNHYRKSSQDVQDCPAKQKGNDCIACWLCRAYTEHCAACSNQTQTARVYQNADSSLSKHEDLTQCCFNVGPAPLAVGKYWNSIGSNPRVCWAPHRCLYTNPSPAIIFSPADQGTFSKTAGQSQAYYNTWNWERGTYHVNHLQILTCEGAVSRVGSVCRAE